MNLSLKDWKSQLEGDKNGIVLDVRTPEEFNQGHIPNAILIDINDPQYFLEKINNLDKTQNYYVYCRSGVRSANACQLMNQIGINMVKNLSGGILEWNGDIC